MKTTILTLPKQTLGVEALFTCATCEKFVVDTQTSCFPDLISEQDNLK